MTLGTERPVAVVVAAALALQALVIAPAVASVEPVRLLVTYTDAVDGNAEAAAFHPARVTADEHLADRVAEVQVLEFDRPRDATRAAQQLRARPDVLAVEPDLLLHPADWTVHEVRGLADEPASPAGGLGTTSVTSGDDLEVASESWGVINDGRTLDGVAGRKGVDVGAAGAWPHATGRNVVVAVIDSGVDVDHPLLRDRMWRNPNEQPDGRDTDGNGFVDDLHGWNFADDTSRLFTSEAVDGHGTHVAGIVAATAHAPSGFQSVAPGARIMALKFIGSEGGKTSDAIRAIRYAVANGAHVINASWGGPEASTALRTELAATPIPVVVAAGNLGARLEDAPSYPASFGLPNLISVAAVEHSGALASFSSRSRNLVDVAAPGARILSPYPNGKLAYASGTSQAAPHVAGVLAIALQRHPKHDPTRLAQAVRDTVRPLRAVTETRSGGIARVPALLDQLGTRVPVCPPATSLAFEDVAVTSPHYQAVACLVSAGVTQGVSATEFGSTRGLTRAQIATLVARAVERTGQLPPPPIKSRFTDVPVTSVHRDAIEALASLGIVRGTTSTTFEPGRTVTRAELAAVTSRATEYLTEGQVRAVGPVFFDLAGVLEAPEIDKSAGLRIVLGRSDGAFEPGKDVRRDQAASMVFRLLDRLAQQGVFDAA
jgi:subtilisin family serine protease